MSAIELITKIRTALSNLAKTQKSELNDTSEFPNYNIVASQLIRLKLLITRNTEASELLCMIPKIQKGALAELKDELPKMTDDKKIQEATEAYEAIKTGLTELEKELTQCLKAAEGSTPKASSM